MAFKELYAFTLDEEKEIEKSHTRKNKKTGEETKVTKKVKEKIPVQIKLKRPSRRELEDAELEYSVEMSRCVKKGILTKAMLYKKYSDTGGVWMRMMLKTTVNFIRKFSISRMNMFV